MTREERREAIEYLKKYKELDERLYQTEPLSHDALVKCLYWEIAMLALEQEPETVTEFADRCRECGAKYGKMLKQKHEPCEDIADALAGYLPTVTPQPKTDVLALLEKTYDDFCKCEGGEGWMEIDGKEYSTDTGYAIEGMRIFMEVFKQRLAESEV